MKSVGLLVIATLFLCGTVYAERIVWYVHPDSALNAIQAGLDSCADNDIVLVGPGTYYENIVWPNTQGIHLTSELGPETTIIDGNGVGTVITCTTGVDITTIIRGFTIRNGNGEWCSGILCDSASPTISDNIVTNNDGVTYGSAILFIGSPIIVRNTITTNIGQGISCVRSFGGVIIDTNVIELNTSTGIYLTDPVFSIRNNTVNHNDMGIVRTMGGNIQHFTSNTMSYNTRDGFGYAPEPDSNEYRDEWSWGGNVMSHNERFGIGGILAVATNDLIQYNGVAGVWGAYGVYLDSCTIAQNYGPGVIINYYDPLLAHIYHCNILDNVGYGVLYEDTVVINAENNWWGDATGPYHPTGNPGGLGDTVSDYVDFDPWLSWPVGVEERPIVKRVETNKNLGATIFHGPLQLPEVKKCKVFDITGRVVEPNEITRGIYFVEIDGVVTQKVVKVR